MVNGTRNGLHPIVPNVMCIPDWGHRITGGDKNPWCVYKALCLDNKARKTEITNIKRRQISKNRNGDKI